VVSCFSIREVEKVKMDTSIGVMGVFNRCNRNSLRGILYY
jgi:hypothetical protein